MNDEFDGVAGYHLPDNLAFAVGAQVRRLQPGGMIALAQAVAGSAVAAGAMSRATADTLVGHAMSQADFAKAWTREFDPASWPAPRLPSPIAAPASAPPVAEPVAPIAEPAALAETAPPYLQAIGLRPQGREQAIQDMRATLVDGPTGTRSAQIPLFDAVGLRPLGREQAMQDMGATWHPPQR